MLPANGTTPKAQQKEGTNNNNNGGGVVGESFRVLYYGSASAGSVPFMWESQPGTPKHALTQSSLPPLTPPPSYQQSNQRYNSSMQVTNHHSWKKRSGFFRNFFLDSPRKKSTAAPPPPASPLSGSVSSSSSSSSSVHSWRSTPTSKTEVRRGVVAEDGGSPTSTLCLGGGVKKSNRVKKMKNAMVCFVRNGRKA
ncbi:hypothetical protein SSX86_018200 [Deinandra increscens subsp. villosa]|uniref:Uncharacterized protein n=1 Tax=Deinandra increscens subsp. villosa TaxID=3103831 RepID=A0AAP0GW43_9ASTR